ncbi:MAG: hypothetical protein ACJAVI_005295 [Candidatus Azotimanducaceae bacterium]|jgi:hypothetical protein
MYNVFFPCMNVCVFLSETPSVCHHNWGRGIIGVGVIFTNRLLSETTELISAISAQPQLTLHAWRIMAKNVQYIPYLKLQDLTITHRNPEARLVINVVET